MPLGAVPALSWRGEVSLGVEISASCIKHRPYLRRPALAMESYRGGGTCTHLSCIYAHNYQSVDLTINV